MTRPTTDKPKHFTWNLNTILNAVVLCGFLYSAITFIAPLKTLPDDVRGMRAEVVAVQNGLGTLQSTQNTQAQALASLATIAKESNDLRREFEVSRVETRTTLQRHEVELERVRAAVEGRAARSPAR